MDTGKFQWAYMGNNPVTGKLHFRGEITELPLFAGNRLVDAGVCVRVADDEPEQGVNIGERSLLIGLNISEQDYRKLQAGDEALSESFGETAKSMRAENQAKARGK